jgi:uncharacterized protein
MKTRTRVSAWLVGLFLAVFAACKHPNTEKGCYPTTEDPQTCQGKCDAGDMEACYSLGGWYVIGAGVKEDDARGIMLWQKACDAGHGFSCGKLASAYLQGEYGVKKDEAKGTALLAKSTCLLEDPQRTGGDCEKGVK